MNKHKCHWIYNIYNLQNKTEMELIKSDIENIVEIRKLFHL